MLPASEFIELYYISYWAGAYGGSSLMPFKSHVSYRVALVFISVIFALHLVAGNDVGLAAEQSPFYQGKVIRVVVGTAPGGGFDVYARAIARHWGKYIPGNPQIIIENQPGAATLVAAKNVFRARPDGLRTLKGTGYFSPRCDHMQRCDRRC